MPSGASRAVMCQAVLMLIVLTLLADAAWVYLLVGHGMFWRTDQRLPPGGVAGTWPSLVAVVPARDEAAVLPETLPTLLTQDYPGQLTVLLVDDESTDGTAGVAAAQGKQAAPARLRVLAGEPTPPGWAGKVWAMAQGLRAAGDADYILFTDADIAYAPGTLRTLVGAAVSSDRGLVSQMALLRTDTLAERLLIPAFVYFFAQLYPFRRVNRRGGRTAAAAGGCMLVRRGALEAAGGLEPISDARIDDVALARLLKRVAPADTWLGFSTGVPAAGRSGAGRPAAVVSLARHRRVRCLGGHVGHLPAGAAALPALAGPGRVPAADRRAVHRDDGQLGQAASRRAGRRVEGARDSRVQAMTIGGTA